MPIWLPSTSLNRTILQTLLKMLTYLIESHCTSVLRRSLGR